MGRKKLAFSLVGICFMSMLGSGCSTTRLTDAQELDLYRAHAGVPVKSFTMLDGFDGWTPLGDSALAVWTEPNQAYLLELQGRCLDLDTAPAITVTNQVNSVYAKFDDVLVVGGMSGDIRMPCRIDTIRPLDIKGLRNAQKQLRQAKPGERGAAVPAQASGT